MNIAETMRRLPTTEQLTDLDAWMASHPDVEVHTPGVPMGRWVAHWAEPEIHGSTTITRLLLADLLAELGRRFPA